MRPTKNRIFAAFGALLLILAASCVSTGGGEEENPEKTETEVENQSEEKTESENQSEGKAEGKTDTRKAPERRSEAGGISRSITGRGIKSEKELYKFFMKNNRKASKRKVKRLAKYYVEEAEIEGINSDVAFVQMCHETGFLRFGNLVTEDMNNFCGLGSTDAQHRGERFATERLGVRAHIQHLQAYATTEDTPLSQELVDPRYSWVHRTRLVTDIFGLTGTWATDPEYGQKLDALLTRLEGK